MMIPQIRGILYYMNQSWQECLNALNDAAQRESKLVLDIISPTLIFARSSELLAVHLLLIYTKNQQGLINGSYILNSKQTSMSDFATTALTIYQKANETAPNRAINIVGMARANIQFGNTNEAVKLYQLLLTQMNLSNNTNSIFTQEANSFIAQITGQFNFASHNLFFI